MLFFARGTWRRTVYHTAGRFGRKIGHEEDIDHGRNAGVTQATLIYPMKVHPSVSRRSFLKSGVAGIVAAAVAPQFVPSRVLGQNSPSKRVALGCIGVGTHGHAVNLMSFLQQDDCVVRAVCDVHGGPPGRAGATP